MRTTLGRRVGIAAAAFGAASSLLVGLSGPASADVVLYQNDKANVRFTGGEVTAMNNCIADAKDGVIQTQFVACDQIAVSGNLVSLDNVNVWVTPAYRVGPILFQKNNVTISVSGGLANAINNCVADAKDGFIQTQVLACRQAATAGNLVTVTNASVLVTQP